MKKQAFRVTVPVRATSRWDSKTGERVPVAARDITVDVEVDVDAIAFYWAPVAAKNKSRMSKNMGGRVVVRHVKTVLHDDVEEARAQGSPLPHLSVLLPKIGR